MILTYEIFSPEISGLISEERKKYDSCIKESSEEEKGINYL